MEKLRKLLFIDGIETITLLIIVSFLLVAEVFFVPGQPQTFDEWAHLLTQNGFFQSLSQGSFPVSWIDTVSNYGSPLGQIAHQTTSYIGALFYTFTGNTLLSYNLTLLLGSILGTILYYLFLRFHFSYLGSLAGAVLFTFAPYRILNIYIRGALPEFFSASFIPLLLIGTHLLFIKKSLSGIIFIFLGSMLLALSHPMMLVIGFGLVAFYLVYSLLNLKSFKQQFKYLFLFLITSLLGILIASYYLFPLVTEIKYFYHGQIGKNLIAYEFLNSDQFFVERWNYSNASSPGVRENRLQLGIIECLILLVTAGMVIYKKFSNQHIPKIVFCWLAAGMCFTFLMTVGSQVLYENIFFLSGLQFPWRFLTALVFIPPLLLAYLIDQAPYQKIFFLLIILTIALLRFPQLYGKNYIQFPESRYSFAKVNPHGTDMNTIWSGPAYDYPVKYQKYEIIEGDGTITDATVTPTAREYNLTASSAVRVIDYTFYFPGWKLYVNNQQTTLEYQDPGYRGVITYRLPAGNYTIQLIYEDTKIRLLSKIISGISLVFVASLVILYEVLPQKKKQLIIKKILS